MVLKDSFQLRDKRLNKLFFGKKNIKIETSSAEITITSCTSAFSFVEHHPKE
jgi:hypothetical protein